MPWIRFGQFELNGKTYELRKGGAPTRIQQQPARVLGLLLSNAGALITRNQIREAIWGNETFVDFEQSLNFCIRHIRMVLNDSAENPEFIETLPRLGYRFIAPVERVDEHTGTAKTRVRIGVLPIEELGTAVEDYFTLGLTEDLISALSRVDSDRLRVVAGPRLRRDSIVEADLEQIQRDLNLNFLLRGWVRRSADAIRICVRLHDLNDGTEIMNSGGHAPNTSNFCLGVWEKVGPREYKLSHFPLPWDPTLGDLYPGTNIPMGQPIGTLHIKAKVTLAPDGQSFTGTFTQILYDTSGNQVPGSKQEGIYTGTRVNVNTPVSSIL